VCPRGRSSQWTCAGTSFVDLPLCCLSIQLSCANRAVVEEPLHLIEGHASTEHLRGPPVAEIVRVDVGEAERDRCGPDDPPSCVGGEGGAARLGARSRMANEEGRSTRVSAELHVVTHGG
jgi:hypothetical protein